MNIPDLLRQTADSLEALRERDHEAVLSGLMEDLQTEIWRLSNINFDYEPCEAERREDLRNQRDCEQYHMER